jgi:hypothetical protein
MYSVKSGHFFLFDRLSCITPRHLLKSSIRRLRLLSKASAIAPAAAPMRSLRPRNHSHHLVSERYAAKVVV